MSEQLYNGPMDVIRRVNHDAEELDYLADSMYECEEVNHKELKELVNELNPGHPLAGQPVVVLGDKLTVRVNEKGVIFANTLPLNDEKIESEGIYRGYVLKTVLDMHSQEKFYRVMHKIELDTLTWEDEFDAQYSVTEFAFVCAYGSEIFPQQPLNAHSFQDLENDNMVAQVDAQVFDESIDETEKLKRISAITNFYLSKREHEIALNYQRISYLNSLGLLALRSIAAYDMAIPDAVGPDGKRGTSYTSLDSISIVNPRQFDVATTYERDKNGLHVRLSEQPALYIVGSSGDREVLLPAKNIVEVN